VGVLLGGLALGLFLRWWQSRAGVRQKARASRQAYDDALAQLQLLFKMVEHGESRPYATESSRIIRRYLENRFGLLAPLRSTEEFLQEAQSSPKLQPAHQQALARFLSVCDLLKFARTHATQAELKELHEAAVQFVKETRRAPVEVQP
jgi:hypothetical protein